MGFCCLFSDQALLQSDTRLVVVNFPHNPTGATLTHGEWEQLLQLVKSKGAFLFSDEMYKFTGKEVYGMCRSTMRVPE